MKKLNITALKVNSFMLVEKVKGGLRQAEVAEKDSWTGSCCSMEPCACDTV